MTKRNKLCTESEKTLQRRKSLEVIPALTCVTLLTMSLGSNIYKVHFKHALTSSDLSFSWKDVLSKSTRFAGIRQVKTRFQMLYFTEAVETAPRNITQTKKTPIRSIALAIMTEKPKKLELQTLSCVWNPKEVIWLLQRTNNLPVWGGVNSTKHETLNLVRCRVLSGFFFLSLALAVSKMLKGKKKKEKTSHHPTKDYCMQESIKLSQIHW